MGPIPSSLMCPTVCLLICLVVCSSLALVWIEFVALWRELDCWRAGFMGQAEMAFKNAKSMRSNRRLVIQITCRRDSCGCFGLYGNPIGWNDWLLFILKFLVQQSFSGSLTKKIKKTKHVFFKRHFPEEFAFSLLLCRIASSKKYKKKKSQILQGIL